MAIVLYKETGIISLWQKIVQGFSYLALMKKNMTSISQTFVSYLYTDSIEGQLPIYTVADLMVLGNMYLIPRLTSLCCVRLQENISIENVAKIYQCASVAGAHALKKRSMRFININFGPV